MAKKRNSGATETNGLVGSEGSDVGTTGSDKATSSDVPAVRGKAGSDAVAKTQPVRRDDSGRKNDPDIHDELAGRSELMRRKGQ